MLGSCDAGTSSATDCAIWEAASGAGLTKPMCIGDVSAGSTCSPTHSAACAVIGISSTDCDAHAGCTWRASSSTCVTTTAFDTCSAQSADQVACEAAGAQPRTEAAAGHCSFRSFASAAAGMACMNAYLGGDTFYGTVAGTCPPYTYDSATGVQPCMLSTHSQCEMDGFGPESNAGACVQTDPTDEVLPFCTIDTESGAALAAANSFTAQQLSDNCCYLSYQVRLQALA